jgi:two-component system, sensor histidine kinase RegB
MPRPFTGRLTRFFSSCESRGRCCGTLSHAYSNRLTYDVIKMSDRFVSTPPKNAKGYSTPSGRGSVGARDPGTPILSRDQRKRLVHLFQHPVRGPEVVESATAVTRDLAPHLALPWIVRLRYGMVAGEAVVILGMSYGLHLDFPLLWTLAPLAIVLASNILLGRLRTLPTQFTQETLGAIFCLDTLCLTAMLGLTGGPMNPFSLLYLVQITLSAVVLRKTWTWALGVLSTACFGLLFFFHVSMAAFESHHVEQGLSPHLIGMWIAFVVAAALITFFTGKIADALRTREQEVLVLQDQVAKNERLASLVTLAAGAAHELGTPLGTIAVVARELERFAANIASNDAVLEDARLIRSEVDRCRRILERMSVQSAEPMGEAPSRVRVRDLLLQTIAQFPESRRALLKIELNDEELAVVLPAQATVQSVNALIQNALDATSDQRPVVISAREADSTLSIAVRDQGHGMPSNVLRRIAEPFFTTKEPGKGMGLGTFLVRTFAESLGGRVLFDSAPGEGTTVTLELPVHSTGRSAHAAV